MKRRCAYFLPLGLKMPSSSSSSRGSGIPHGQRCGDGWEKNDECWVWVGVGLSLFKPYSKHTYGKITVIQCHITVMVESSLPLDGMKYRYIYFSKRDILFNYVHCH